MDEAREEQEEDDDDEEEAEEDAEDRLHESSIHGCRFCRA